MKVLILGSTGLVGSQLLELLLNDSKVSSVTAITRRELTKHNKLNNVISDLSNIEQLKELFKVDSLYCCLGTTIKTAGSKESFRKIDYHYPLEAAQKLKEQSPLGTYCIISALGANSKSSIFYNKVKGNIEDDLKSLDLNKLIIIRPSLLMGERKEKRFSESLAISLMKVINPMMLGPLKKYRGIAAQAVAKKMILETRKKSNGKLTIIENDSI